jgi:phenylpyruvate tautomerase PptA (4-oxalocrotonate tautomerase family)
MPLIQIDISKEITKEQKEAIKSEAGRLIGILPGKSEKVLMVIIREGSNMYFRGKAEDCAFIEAKLFHESPIDSKSEFAKKFCEAISEILKIETGNIFMVFAEYANWVSGGALKQ